jgi:hypothetical protein
VFVIGVNRQGVFEPAGRDIKLLTASGAERLGTFKTPSPPDGDEPDYFGRIKNLAKAKKLTIVKITPYYGEGIYREASTNGESSRIVVPIAELETIANFGNSNVTVRLLSPILSSEVSRLLETKLK